MTVADCARDRPADLARCLRPLDQMTTPSLVIIVVDNAPVTGETEALVTMPCQVAVDGEETSSGRQSLPIDGRMLRLDTFRTLWGRVERPSHCPEGAGRFVP